MLSYEEIHNIEYSCFFPGATQDKSTYFWLLVLPLFCIYRFQVNAFDIYNAQILNVASVVGFVNDLSSSKWLNKLNCEIETCNICI